MRYRDYKSEKDRDNDRDYVGTSVRIHCLIPSEAPAGLEESSASHSERGLALLGDLAPRTVY